MSRFLTELPEKFIYSKPYTVLFRDINATNHVGADRLLPMALEAQFGLIRSLGYKDAVVFEDAGLIMANSQTDYISETYYNDELRIDCGVDIISEKSFDIIYSIYNETRDRETARIKARMLFFDYNQGKVISVPDGFLERVREKLSAS